MKFSPETLKVLRSWCVISSNILFLKGHKQRTISAIKSIYAEAELKEDFPKEVALYNLNQLLALHRLFKDPDVDFQDHYVELRAGNASARIAYCEPKQIRYPKDKERNDLTFKTLCKISSDSMSAFARVPKALGWSHGAGFVINGDGSTITATIELLPEPGVHIDHPDYYTVIAGKTTEHFRYVMDVEVQRMLPYDYEVQLVTIDKVDYAVRFNAQGTSLWYVVPLQIPKPSKKTKAVVLSQRNQSQEPTTYLAEAV